MFWKKSVETGRFEELERKIENLTNERRTLKEEVEDLKIKKKIETEDIKHMVKMKEEKNDLEFQKKVMEKEQEKQAAIATVKDEYRNKLEKNLIAQKDDIKEMYSQILKRLPDVNARLTIKQEG